MEGDFSDLFFWVFLPYRVFVPFTCKPIDLGGGHG